MNATPPPNPTRSPPRHHWSRHLVRLIAVVAMIAIVAFLYSKGVR